MLINSRPKAKSLRDVMFPPTLNPADVHRKTPGQTVIAHISDLHFTSRTNFETGPWAALLEDLTSNNRPKVDLLAVTGDLIDASFRDSIRSLFPKAIIKDPIEEAFLKVNTYLRKLCGALDVKCDTGLFVVPGNHDYRAKGILLSKKQPGKFYNVFKTCCRPVLLPQLHLCVFVLDSNTMRNKYDLATGLIEKDDLVKFRGFAEKIRPHNSACTRIVLLHHHPMPIPARETEKFGDNPGFSLLKNAGQFMSLMVEARINLVLHGHEHHPAFSKAFFPDDKLQEHMITVVGAGSAGEGVPNYNLLTITDGGQMLLERRMLEGGVFRHQYERPLGHYEDARRAAFQGLAEKTNAIIRADKYSEVYVVKSGSGDADWYERFEGLKAFKEDVSEWPTAVASDSGFFSSPKFQSINPDGQDIRWDWQSHLGAVAEVDVSERKARILFKPSINKSQGVKYEARRKAYNLFHFNQQDREDTTNGKSKQDWIGFTFRNAFDLYVLTVCFPEGNFPAKFYREVHTPDCYGKSEHDDTCIHDPLEEQYFDRHFSKFKDTNTIVMAIEKPLPGYTYRILWDLPLEEHKMALTDQGRALDMIERLLQLRESTAPHRCAAEGWLNKLREDITKSKMWRSLKGIDEMEIFLYTYNSETTDWEKRGLVCVATTLPGLINGDEEEVIKPGKTIIGASYRRKEPMIYSPVGKNPKLAESEYLNRIPKMWNQSNGQPPKKFTAVWTIPLYYPVREGFIGRKVAVLSFASTSNQSRLLNFVTGNYVGLSQAEIDELKNKRDALEYFAMTTKFQELARILEVESTE